MAQAMNYQHPHFHVQRRGTCRKSMADMGTGLEAERPLPTSKVNKTHVKKVHQTSITQCAAAVGLLSNLPQACIHRALGACSMSSLRTPMPQRRNHNTQHSNQDELQLHLALFLATHQLPSRLH